MGQGLRVRKVALGPSASRTNLATVHKGKGGGVSADGALKKRERLRRPSGAPRPIDKALDVVGLLGESSVEGHGGAGDHRVSRKSRRRRAGRPTPACAR